MLRKVMCLLVVAVLLGIGSVQGAIYFAVTDITGAQVQVDVNHTQYWTYAVNVDVDDVVGGRFTIKRGPQTNEPITLDIIQGTLADFGTATPLLTVTNQPADVTQSYDWVDFTTTGSGITLEAGRIYTAILYSNSVDAQNAAYFIKGGDEAAIIDSETGQAVPGVEVDLDPDVPDLPAVPEPATLAIWSLLGVAGLALRRFKAA